MTITILLLDVPYIGGKYSISQTDPNYPIILAFIHHFHDIPIIFPWYGHKMVASHSILGSICQLPGSLAPFWSMESRWEMWDWDGFAIGNHRKKGFKLQIMGLFWWWGSIFNLLKIEQLRTFLGFDGRSGGSKWGLRECSNWRTETWTTRSHSRGNTVAGLIPTQPIDSPKSVHSQNQNQTRYIALNDEEWTSFIQ